MKTTTRQSREPLLPSELVLNSDGAVYHLGLHPDQLAEKVIVVGDPARVKRISDKFNVVEHRVESREFVTHTGLYGGTRITALSTGIGVDNIDIVMNELDALVNIDLKTKQIKERSHYLSIVRIGTSGALQEHIPVGDTVHTAYALGLDGMLHYYDYEMESDEQKLAHDFMAHTRWPIDGIKPYAVKGHSFLDTAFRSFSTAGVTVTANGFYGPQGRKLRLNPAFEEINNLMSTFSFEGIPLANYEMESSGLLGLGALLGHQCTTVCTVIANRLRNEFLDDYQPHIDRLIVRVLDALAAD